MIDGPQDLRVVAVTPTTLELSWLRPQAEVDRFVVSYVSAGNQRVRLEVPPKADGTLLTDLMPGVEYVVTVTAERGRAVSYPASVRANTGMASQGLGKGPNFQDRELRSEVHSLLRMHLAGCVAIPKHLLLCSEVTEDTGAWSPIARLQIRLWKELPHGKEMLSFLTEAVVLKVRSCRNWNRADYKSAVLILVFRILVSRSWVSRP